MSEPSDNTPFLADNEHEEESHVIKTSPANSQFKRPLRILAVFDSIFSILVFALLIVTYVFINTGSFTYTYGAEETIRDLSIALFINFVLSTPTIFLSLPIWLNLASHLSMSIVVLVFSGKIFGRGWPDDSFCRRWNGPPDYGFTPGPRKCFRQRDIIRINMGVAAGFGILIGLLILTKLLLRIIAVARTKFWHKANFSGLKWNPTGFTVQFTLSVLPHDSKRTAVNTVAQGTEEGTLVET